MGIAVNHANAYGEMDNPGSGPELASQVIGDVLDEEINYYLRIDFKGFEEFVDAIGGVDVYIENGFTDSNYPIEGKEYDECGDEPSETSDLLVESDPETTEVAAGFSLRESQEEPTELAQILAIDEEEEISKKPSMKKISRGSAGLFLPL